MPYEVIFLIPPVTGIAWVIHQFIRHRQETKVWVAHCPYQIRVIDSIPYVVPRPRVS